DKARKRAAQRAHDVAAELLQIQARRAARPGMKLAVNDADYQRFCASFPFTSTPDQQKAIDDVLADMAAEKPMDRVVCGDVGFGKTEVALRAAFAAVQNGRQVCVLAPTTLLTEQHHKNFSDRFAGWPVKIGALSRMRTAREQKALLQELADGKVDIVIGTHRLLQQDVAFGNLGLVIVDEEHRFGVRHKERMKNLRAEVDMLTLTATPIPRTLNMSLAGLRDLSIIATPPEGRLPIRTFVAEEDRGLIYEACLRELRRGGQTLDHRPLVALGAEAGEHLHPHREGAQPLSEGVEVLLGEDGGGHQHGHLPATQHRLEGGAQRHLGLAIAHVAHQQPIHGPRPLHVGPGLL
ncbi:MAG: DEAD/DEAH box helicase, partial [Hydrocarboniphaga effusa]|nr:DEAD/DEAH box helicase [Hydrocarboniphaga effusa]